MNFTFYRFNVVGIFMHSIFYPADNRLLMNEWALSIFFHTSVVLLYEKLYFRAKC